MKSQVFIIKIPAFIDFGVNCTIILITCIGQFRFIFFNPYTAGGLFGQYKMMQKNWKMIETMAYGYSSESTQQELSNEYQYDRV